MKREIFVFLVVLALILFLTGLAFGAEKELSVSIQVVEENTSDNNEDADSIGEFGTFKGPVETELTTSSNQNIIQRMFLNKLEGELLSVKVEKTFIIFIFLVLAASLFMAYVILLLFKIKRTWKRKKRLHKKSK
ncbi:hypothetical protein J4429_03935 [Candidatus Pacearchaeota archaeon]|nr:hypothetical protein [uncultured archaeon]AQS32523.1 hypothetical protein [uncultured archaeon]MBS3075583.1 hypothetical protein [Candidatus Pacearchaeota archaeon]